MTDLTAQPPYTSLSHLGESMSSNGAEGAAVAWICLYSGHRRGEQQSRWHSSEYQSLLETNPSKEGFTDFGMDRAWRQRRWGCNRRGHRLLVYERLPAKGRPRVER